MNFTNGGVVGADVSFYQDNNQTPQQIDFTKMVEQGASFVVIRAGQNLWIDPDLAYNWSKSQEAGLPRGSYWFYDSRVSPIQQAVLFALQFADDPPELELWLDLEEHYGGPYGGWINWKKFLNKLRELMPSAKIGIYTGYYYISGRIPAEEYSYFLQFALWLAWYGKVENVLIPAPWRSCLYWQFGTPSWGLAWGCESLEIDMNLFNGTKEDFNRRYSLGGTVADIYRVTWENGCNKRPAPNVNNTPVGIIPLGQEFDVVAYYVPDGKTAAQERWGQLSDSFWVALTYNSMERAVLVSSPPPSVALMHTIEVYSDGSLRIDGKPYA